MSLYLSGGGQGSGFAALLAHFCQDLDPERQVLFIPHARSQSEWLDAAREIKSELAPHGIRHFMLEAELRFIQAEPEELAAIYIADGDAGRLHDHLMHPRFQAWLQQAYALYLPIFAVGAGAVLMGKDIRTTPATQARAPERRKGLNWLGGASVVCPHTPQERPEARFFPLWALAPDSGLRLEADGFHVMGTCESECWLAGQSLSYAPGIHLQI